MDLRGDIYYQSDHHVIYYFPHYVPVVIHKYVNHRSLYHLSCLVEIKNQLEGLGQCPFPLFFVDDDTQKHPSYLILPMFKRLLENHLLSTFWVPWFNNELFTKNCSLICSIIWFCIV